MNKNEQDLIFNATKEIFIKIVDAAKFSGTDAQMAQLGKSFKALVKDIKEAYLSLGS